MHAKALTVHFLSASKRQEDFSKHNLRLHCTSPPTGHARETRALLAAVFSFIHTKQTKHIHNSRPHRRTLAIFKLTFFIWV
jgi:hypothetical protein